VWRGRYHGMRMLDRRGEIGPRIGVIVLGLSGWRGVALSRTRRSGVPTPANVDGPRSLAATTDGPDSVIVRPLSRDVEGQGRMGDEGGRENTITIAIAIATQSRNRNRNRPHHGILNQQGKKPPLLHTSLRTATPRARTTAFRRAYREFSNRATSGRRSRTEHSGAPFVADCPRSIL
jgi:hypothetical protein